VRTIYILIALSEEIPAPLKWVIDKLEGMTCFHGAFNGRYKWCKGA
jgi:hypothetical protein